MADTAVAFTFVGDDPESNLFFAIVLAKLSDERLCFETYAAHRGGQVHQSSAKPGLFEGNDLPNPQSGA